MKEQCNCGPNPSNPGGECVCPKTSDEKKRWNDLAKISLYQLGAIEILSSFIGADVRLITSTNFHGDPPGVIRKYISISDSEGNSVLVTGGTDGRLRAVRVLGNLEIEK